MLFGIISSNTSHVNGNGYPVMLVPVVAVG